MSLGLGTYMCCISTSAVEQSPPPMTLAGYSGATRANEGSTYASRQRLSRSSGLSMSLSLSVPQIVGRSPLSRLLHGTCIGVAGLSTSTRRPTGSRPALATKGRDIGLRSAAGTHSAPNIEHSSFIPHSFQAEKVTFAWAQAGRDYLYVTR